MRARRLGRREACRRLALGVTCVLGGAGRGAPEPSGETAEPDWSPETEPDSSPEAEPGSGEPFRLRYVLASSLYGRTRVEEILPEVPKTGARPIDLWPEPHANQREQVDAMGRDRFAKLLEEHEVRLGMTTRYDLGPFGLGDEMRFLRDFSGTLIVTGSRGPKGLAGDALEAAIRDFVEKMEPHVVLAAKLGVRIGIENHADALIASPESLRRFADLVRSPHLGIALAPYHLPQDPALLARLIEDLGPRLVHFYAWQHGKGCMQKLPKAQELEQMPGRGPLDFEPILRALRKIGYAGWTEIFMHPVPRGIPILDSTRLVTEEVIRARTYLEKVEKGAAR